MQTVHIQAVIFTVENDTLQVFLPAGRLPQSQLSHGHTLDEEAVALFESAASQTGRGVFYEQLYTFSSAHDTSVRVAYYFLLPAHQLPQISNAWVNAAKHINNREDSEVVSYAVQRLRWKLEYTNAVYSLLPGEFTLTELQHTYEAILGKELDKRNFRKKILSLHLLTEVSGKKRGSAARPAQLYAFITRHPMRVKVF